MIKEIASAELRPGMFLEKLSGSWINHPFWRSSFLLNDPEDIARIVDSGITRVWINTAKGLDVAVVAEPEVQPEPEARPEPAIADDPPSPAAEAPAIITASTSMEAECARARQICHQSRDAVESMFQEARMGQAISADGARPLVEEISASVMRNSEALISIARLKNRDDYTYMHSVAVCALMVALARELKLDEEQVTEAGIGGLMHDLGKAMMPLEVLNKPGKLTDGEFEIMKSHPAKGHGLLSEGGGALASTLDIVLHHHEKMDGSGYPEKLAGESISILSRMGAVCDVYDAVTSDRPYKEGWDPAVSVKRMASWQGHFDERIFRAFVKSIGIYPTGSLVRLESGKLGVVISQGEGSLLTPRVKVFYSARAKQAVPMAVIDLAAPGCEDRILSAEDSAQWGFKKLDQLWLAS